MLIIKAFQHTPLYVGANTIHRREAENNEKWG
jgi:hypothetical protein